MSLPAPRSLPGSRFSDEVDGLERSFSKQVSPTALAQRRLTAVTSPQPVVLTDAVSTESVLSCVSAVRRFASCVNVPILLATDAVVGQPKDDQSGPGTEVRQVITLLLDTVGFAVVVLTKTNRGSARQVFGRRLERKSQAELWVGQVEPRQHGCLVVLHALTQVSPVV